MNIKDKIKTMIRRRFGGWTFSHDRATGCYFVCNHYKGITCVEDSGVAGAGDTIPYPKGCRNPEYILH